MNWENYYDDLTIPVDWQDSCSGNDLLPSFTAATSGGEYQIFIDSYDWDVRSVNTEDVTGSKSPLLPRFTVKICSHEDLYALFETFDQVIAFINR